MSAILKPILVDMHVKISLEHLCACVQKVSESWMLEMNVKTSTNVPSILTFAGEVVGVLIGKTQFDQRGSYAKLLHRS